MRLIFPALALSFAMAFSPGFVLAGVGGFDLPRIQFPDLSPRPAPQPSPQPAPPTQGCADPATLSGTGCVPAGE